MREGSLVASLSPTVDKFRFEKLDLMRGVAAMFVVALHVPNVPIKFIGFSFLWVDFFFLLSGFVLQPSLAKSRLHPSRQNQFRFIKERIVRLFPVAWIGLAAVFLKSFILYLVFIYLHKGVLETPFGRERPVYSFFLALLLLQFFSAAAEHWIGPLWSLSVEWLVNIIDIAIFVGNKIVLLGLQALAGISLVVISDSLLSKVSPWFWIHDFGRGVAGFAIGAMLRIFFQTKSFRSRFSTPIVLLSLFSTWFIWKTYPVFVWYWSIPTFCLVIWLLASSNVKSSRFSFYFRWMGNMSYGIYVYHSVCLGGLIAISNFFNFNLDWEIKLFLVMALSFSSAACSRKYLEPKISLWLRKALKITPA